jgi:hypothetical protein
VRAHARAWDRQAHLTWPAALAALGTVFLAAPVANGAVTADWHFKNRWDWRGIDVIRPRAAQCRAHQVRVLNSSIRNLYGFEYLLGGALEPINAATAPVRDVSEIDCPIYGWGEHFLGVNDNRYWY